LQLAARPLVFQMDPAYSPPKNSAYFHGTIRSNGPYLFRGANQTKGKSMNSLPVDRALIIYGALADRSETKGARERLSEHLMKMYIEGEKDEHRLTVEGLAYLRDLDQEIDSRN
jgi:hypothetical protein